MVEREVDLVHAQAGARGVDRHPHLTAEPCGDREACGTRGGREGSLPRERLTRLDPAKQLDQIVCHPFCEPETSADPLGEGGDAQVRLPVEQRLELPGQVGVTQQEPPRRRGAFGRRQRLALAAAPQTENDRPRLLRRVGGAVA